MGKLVQSNHIQWLKHFAKPHPNRNLKAYKGFKFPCLLYDNDVHERNDPFNVRTKYMQYI